MDASRRLVLTAIVAVVAVAGAIVAFVLASSADQPSAAPNASSSSPPPSGAGPGPTEPPAMPVWGFARFDDVDLPMGESAQVGGALQAGSWQSVPATAGHTVSVTHVDVGRYRVAFPDIAVPGGFGAAVASSVATTQSPAVPSCHVVNWRQAAVDQQVEVGCQTVDAVDVDSGFTVMFTYAPDDYRPDGGEPYAYVSNDVPSADEVGPGDVSGYSLAGPDTIAIRREGAGHYSVDLVGELYARTGNNLQVNATGDTDAGCNAVGRVVKDDRQTIFVGCAVGEQWTDTPFVVVYGDQHSLLPEEFRSFGHAFTGVTQNGSPAMPPPLGRTVDAWAQYSANSADATNTVRRVEVGRYEVTFPGVARAPDHVQLTPYGEPTARCVLDGWTSPPSSAPAGDVTVTFRCVDAFGEPVDSYASVAYVSALSAAAPTAIPALTPTPTRTGTATSTAATPTPTRPRP